MIIDDLFLSIRYSFRKNSKLILFLSLLAFIVVLLLASSQNSEGKSENGCAPGGEQCHYHQPPGGIPVNQFVDVLEEDESTQIPETIDISETKTIKLVIENEIDVDDYKRFKYVDVSLESENDTVEITNPDKRINNMQEGTETLTWEITGKSDGTDTLQFSVHANNQHKNCNFYDSYSQSITVMALDHELGVSEISIPFEPVVEDQIITLGADIANIGIKNTSAHLKFYYDEKDEEHRIATVKDVMVKAKTNSLFEVEWNTSGLQGNHIIFVVLSDITPEDTMAENNEMQIVVRVLSKPDLAWDTIAFFPSVPIEGDIVSVELNVVNSGESSSYFEIALYMGIMDIEHIIGNGSFSISGEHSRGFDMVWNTTGQWGNRTIFAVLKNSTPHESTEDNNIMSRTVRILIKPDILVRSIETEEPLIEGDQEPISAVISNQGEAQAVCDVWFYYDEMEDHYLIGKAIGISVEGREGENQTTVVCPMDWDTSGLAGDHLLIVRIYNVSPMESDTSNNLELNLIRVLTRPDLSVREIILSREIPFEGEAIGIRTGIINNGETDTIARIAFYWDMKTSDHLIGRMEETMIPHLATTFISSPFDWDTTDLLGNRSIIVRIEASFPTESDISNNEAQQITRVVTRPDLIIRELKAVEPILIEGSAITFQANVSNQGETGANFTVSFFYNFIDAEHMFNVRHVSVPALKSMTIISDGWDTEGKSGYHRIYAVIQDSIPGESDITNNGFDILIRVLTRPRLSVIDIFLSDYLFMEGDMIDISATISNSGETNAVFDIVFCLDNSKPNNYVTLMTGIELSAFSTIEIEYEWNTSEILGEHTLYVNVVNSTPDDERHEKNIGKVNIYASSQPDIVLVENSISLSEGRPVEGQSIAINATILNQGQTDAMIDVTFYINTLDDQHLIAIQSNISILAGSTVNVQSPETLNTVGLSGPHTIIVVLEGSSPSESNTTNNRGELDFIVSKDEGFEPEQAMYMVAVAFVIGAGAIVISGKVKVDRGKG